MDERKQALRTMFEKAELPLSDEELKILEEAKQLVNAWVPAFYTLYSSRLLEQALKRHAVALGEAARSSEKHAKGLKYATWALFVATLVLAATSLSVSCAR